MYWKDDFCESFQKKEALIKWKITVNKGVLCLRHTVELGHLLRVISMCRKQFICTKIYMGYFV